MKIAIFITLVISIISSSIFACAADNHGIIVKHEEWHDVPLPENLKHGNVNIQNLQTTSNSSFSGTTNKQHQDN
jgi:hypothetical protein